MTEQASLDLSVVIPALREADNLRVLLPWLVEVLNDLGVTHEVIVVTGEGDTDTVYAAEEAGGSVVHQTLPGYGGALIAGFEAAKGGSILTMDADLSHRPTFVADMWRRRGEADVVVASRYVPGGTAKMPMGRYVLSRILNMFFRRGLDLPMHDLSSGFRLYRAAVVRDQRFHARDFDAVQEILVRAFCEGWRILEVPFEYAPRRHGSSNARVVRIGRANLRSFVRLWKLRNSIDACDYDDRAYDSPIPLQRWWQRRRYRHITDLITGCGPVLDVGCGSSRIISALPSGSVGLDVLARKLRYARRYPVPLVQGSGFALPFPDGSFPCVLSSEVIEHVPKESPILEELCRVLAPGGRLVLGTPDYDRREWVYLEKIYGWVAPGGYADEHIAHYSRAELLDYFQARGFVHEATRYIMRGELILAFRKPLP
jgi:dolichol-phosphate mannosyltransferase